MEALIQSRVYPCGICDVQSGIGTGFSQSILDSLCQYHSTNAPYSSSSYYSYQKDTWKKPGNLHKAKLIWKSESIKKESTFLRPSQVNTVSIS
jgi:hypothetical protein